MYVYIYIYPHRGYSACICVENCALLISQSINPQNLPSAMDDDDLDPAYADALDDRTTARAEKAAKVAQSQALKKRTVVDVWVW